MTRPYISIDIETTGISEECEILQISAVFDDGKGEINSLQTLDLPIKHEVMKYCEPYAMGMNAELLKKMMNKDFVTYTPQKAITELLTFMRKVQEASGTDSRGKPQKVILAGKNVASFDIPRIRRFILNNFSSAINEFDSLLHYKTLDVGSLYYDVFGDNVSLTEINKLTGRKEVSHNALDDAFDVVYAVRYKLDKAVANG